MYRPTGRASKCRPRGWGLNGLYSGERFPFLRCSFSVGARWCPRLVTGPTGCAQILSPHCSTFVRNPCTATTIIIISILPKGKGEVVCHLWTVCSLVPSETDERWAGQEIHHLYWNAKGHCCIHRSQLLHSLRKLTGFIRFWIGSSDRLFWTRRWTANSVKCGDFSSAAETPFNSLEGPCFVELLKYFLHLPWITKQFLSNCGFYLRQQYFLYTKGLWEPKEFTKDRCSHFVNIADSYIFLPAIEVR